MVSRQAFPFGISKFSGANCQLNFQGVISPACSTDHLDMSSLMVAQHNAAGTTGNHHSLPHLDILQRLGSLVTTLDWLIFGSLQSNKAYSDIIPKKWWNTIQPGYEDKPTWIGVITAPKSYSPTPSYTKGFIPNKGKTQKWKPGNLAFGHPSRSPE